MGQRLVTGVLFFPRGGSAHVNRALSIELARRGWEVTLMTGSRSDLEGQGDAASFYEGIDVRAVDFSAALASPDPMRFEALPGSAPMHPSFEDRPDAPDAVFASLDDGDFERQVGAWARELEAAGAAEADVLYLHHLTPLNEATRRVAPEVPVIGHLHGTELLMLERIEGGAPKSWRYADRWAERMRSWARRCELMMVSPAGRERAAELLGLQPERFVELANGFDPDLFAPREVDRAEHWRRNLVAEPRGWRPGAGAGGVSYTEDELEPLRDGSVLLYVGRFTEVKRLPMLLAAWVRARDAFEHPAALAIVGGHPGEWEGEHPAETIERLGLDDVFLAGWHGHAELPDFLAASDALILPSAREQFGQTIVEAMACARPPIGADVLGPASIIDPGETGWLFESDDEGSLVRVLAEAINDDQERRRRGELARQVALERYSWPSLGARLDTALHEAIAEGVPG